jgi:23S rRNA pseudouridine1911/1915/1917 synthase
VHYDRRRAPGAFDDRTRTSRRTSEIDGHLNRHTVTAEEAGARTDVTVARLAGASRSRVAAAIDEHRVLLNGDVPKPSATLEEGDVLEFLVPAPVLLEARAQAIPIDIVFEDDAIVVVHKAAGMVSHPAHGSRQGTLVNALLAHAGALPGDPLRPGLVHRLDRDTSGLLVVAKTELALRRLGKAMMRRLILREYLGLVAGVPEHPKGTIQGAIGRDTNNRLKFAVRAEGKPAVTHYEVREALAGASELLFKLETGRTHQIRVHMAAFGHPLINDSLYGKRDARVALPGQALHAWRLAFAHPLTGEMLVFEAPPPQEYVRARDALRS